MSPLDTALLKTVLDYNKKTLRNNLVGEIVVDFLCKNEFNALQTMLDEGYSFTPNFTDEHMDLLFNILERWVTDVSYPLERYALYIKVTNNCPHDIDFLYEFKFDALEYLVQQGHNVDTSQLYDKYSNSSGSVSEFSIKVEKLLDLGLYPPEEKAGDDLIYRVEPETAARLIDMGLRSSDSANESILTELALITRKKAKGSR